MTGKEDIGRRVVINKLDDYGTVEFWDDRFDKWGIRLDSTGDIIRMRRDHWINPGDGIGFAFAPKLINVTGEVEEW